MSRASRLMRKIYEINEDNDVIPIQRATMSDKRKGESYVVYDTDTKSIVSYNGTRMSGVRRETARAVCTRNNKWTVASASWAEDKGIK